MKMRYSDLIRSILEPAGISLNGNNPWDIQIRDERFYRRVIREGSVGLGESYMDGWWECERLDDFFYRLMPSDPEKKLPVNFKILRGLVGPVILNPGSRSRAFEIGKRHYDTGNFLFRHMLDRRMAYSCAYWNEADNLDDAQDAKLELICRKIGVRKGDRILDIGCGWGSFAIYAAERYGAEVVGITVSKKQMALAQELSQGFPVEIRLQDYREVNEPFHHIVSVGMFEHVGYKNHRTFMQMVHRCLKDEGFFLLHTIGSDISNVSADPWLSKYIFPNSLIPSLQQISASIEGLFVMEDWHNFGSHYEPTLMSWFANFDRNWPILSERYDARFYRMWKYYLLSCAGLFRSRCMQVWQVVFSKKGLPGGYCSIR
jgi:cyclopropane-fatty-acyl-phospholipid synthase